MISESSSHACVLCDREQIEERVRARFATEEADLQRMAGEWLIRRHIEHALND